MFYDKHSMIEMYELSLMKKKKRGVGWKTILLTSVVHVETFLSQKDLIELHRKWCESLKNFLHEKDAACMINNGNIFLLIHENHFDDFKTKILSLKATSSENKGSVLSSVLFLIEEEVEFLLTLPN